MIDIEKYIEENNIIFPEIKQYVSYSVNYICSI